MLLHAALEDLVRSIQRRRLPSAPVEVLNAIDLPTPHGSSKPKVGLGTFAIQFRGLSVDDAVQACVEAHLEKKTFNNLSDVAAALAAVGVSEPGTLLGDDAEGVNKMTLRRHLIAHRADGDPSVEAHAAATRSIASPTVVGWGAAVRRVGDRILRAVRELEESEDVD